MIPITEQQLHDAINDFDLALMRAFDLVKHLTKERHPLARQLSAALKKAQIHECTIVEAAVYTPSAAEPESQPATVLHLVPQIETQN